MTDLNTLVPADSPLYLYDPAGINSRGQIVGLGFDKNTFEAHGFLLTPVDTEVVGEGAAAAALSNDSKGPKIIIPENVRRALQHRARSRDHIDIGPAMN
jgi:hypothetical protein